jgi:hypothetical protein
VLGVTVDAGLVFIDPHTGARTSPAALGGTYPTGEEVSVTADGSTIYYEQQYGCTDRIYSVPAAGGGAPTLVTAGRWPAVSPDGTQLAYTREPAGPATCAEHYPVSQYLLVVRNLRSGGETTYPVSPQLAQLGLDHPIDHLSWSSDGRRLLVSVEAPEDNVGRALVVLDPRTAHYYLTAVPSESVPVSQDSQGTSYYREGVFMPDGNLFVNRVCCADIRPTGPRVASTLLWEVTATGTLVKQVAIGFTDRDHSSLAADPTGAELLYLSGTDLYVSDGGQRPRLVTGGLTAATFISTATPR